MLEVKVERCAGIDVGKKFVDVGVTIGPADRKPTEEVRRFGTNVRDLKQLREWLLEKGCLEVVMESTGSYWKPLFNVLERHSKVILANPLQVKALRGKKTDRKDCCWLEGLLRHGLVGQLHPPARHSRTPRSDSPMQNCSIERQRSMPVVLEPVSLHSSWRQWNYRIEPIQSLNGGPLINTQHDGVVCGFK